jgi:hypothetical protein
MVKSLNPGIGRVISVITKAIKSQRRQLYEEMEEKQEDIAWKLCRYTEICNFQVLKGNIFHPHFCK